MAIDKEFIIQGLTRFILDRAPSGFSAEPRQIAQLAELELENIATRARRWRLYEAQGCGIGAIADTDLGVIVDPLTTFISQQLPRSWQPDRMQIATLAEFELGNIFSGSMDIGLPVFLPGSNPIIKQCDMPHNQHRFTDNGRGKHCAGCQVDYCDRHAISHCVKCGASI